ncbi:hypothetical protein THAOC_16939 [Thalassiosira oceanica]|uniref:Uncharacterized protein n=1 Tax=Thalassiosira oceanica TaxID=159749 RepID=K0SW05_THAOC|nr:hypothetical protein THAOC_16939 [Thalassiosira oceanica]|eukprot:EJK62452.1 hypothetical protein THAOC_16939 [Thalassiosira oceanica]
MATYAAGKLSFYLIRSSLNHGVEVVLFYNYYFCLFRQATRWPSGLRRCVKAAVFWAWVQIPLESLPFYFTLLLCPAS